MNDNPNLIGGRYCVRHKLNDDLIIMFRSRLIGYTFKRRDYFIRIDYKSTQKDMTILLEIIFKITLKKKSNYEFSAELY